MHENVGADQRIWNICALHKENMSTECENLEFWRLADCLLNLEYVLEDKKVWNQLIAGSQH